MVAHSQWDLTGPKLIRPSLCSSRPRARSSNSVNSTCAREHALMVTGQSISSTAAPQTACLLACLPYVPRALHRLWSSDGLLTSHVCVQMQVSPPHQQAAPSPQRQGLPTAAERAIVCALHQEGLVSRGAASRSRSRHEPAVPMHQLHCSCGAAVLCSTCSM